MIKPYIIAECGINYVFDTGQNRKTSLDVIEEMIIRAKECNCDAVKFQLYDMAEKIKPGRNDDWLRIAQLRDEELDLISSAAGAAGIDWFCSVFSQSCLEKVLAFKPKMWKTAAPDLLRGVQWAEAVSVPWWASYDQRFEMIDANYNWLKAVRADKLLLCVSDYPAMISDYEYEMNDTTDCFDGVSDHTLGLELVEYHAGYSPIWEKHFTLNKFGGGPDHWFSLDPAEMMRYVEIIHTAHENYELERKRLESYYGRFE